MFPKRSHFRINSTDVISIKLFSVVQRYVVSNCDPMDCRLPGSTVCGISQVRIQEWVAFPSPGDLPNPGIEPASPALQMASLQLRHQGKPELQIAAAAAKSLQLCPTPSDPMDCSLTRLLRLWEFPGKSTGVGCISFSRGSSQPRDGIWVSRIAGRFFTI